MAILLEDMLPGVKYNGINTNKQINAYGGVASPKPVVSVTTATKTLASTDSGSVVILSKADGATVTLPAPSVGLTFKFIVPTSVTSNSYKIITDAATTFILGQLNLPVAAGTCKEFFADGSTHVSINGNGTTTGGLAGSQFELTCISATQWNVEGTFDASGTVATPFATT